MTAPAHFIDEEEKCIPHMLQSGMMLKTESNAPISEVLLKAMEE